MAFGVYGGSATWRKKYRQVRSVVSGGCGAARSSDDAGNTRNRPPFFQGFAISVKIVKICEKIAQNLSDSGDFGCDSLESGVSVRLHPPEKQQLNQRSSHKKIGIPTVFHFH